MNGKSLGMLMMAVLCGLGAMYGTSRLIAKKGEPVLEMQDVLIAVRDLKIEEVIKPDLVKVSRMPRAAVPAGAFSSAKDVDDRWVQTGILEGEPIVDRKLAARGSPPGLVARIPKGMRAFALEVNETTGVSGFVLPDHRVDIIQMLPGVGGQPPEAETVLQDVLILASGQTFTRPDDRSLQSRTVTVAVTPEQVDALVSARSHGALSLSLRGPNDHVQSKSVKKMPPAPVPLPEPKVETVIVKAPEPAPTPPPAVVEPPLPPPAPPARFVMLYRGLDNKRQIRVDQADIDQPDDLAPSRTQSPPRTRPYKSEDRIRAPERPEQIPAAPARA